jgi:dihydroflavonol-4-reductase
MFGPWDWKPSSGRMLLEVARHPLLGAPPGGNDFCDVRDVAAGTLAAAERGRAGRRYILGGEALSYYQAWQMISEVTGGARIIGLPGPWLTRAIGLGGTLWGRLSGHEPDVNTAAAALAVLPHHYRYTRAQLELGYSPRPAREAIEAAWSWFVEHGYTTARHRQVA